MKKLLFSLLICSSVWAQNTGNIKGTVAQSTGESVSFANVFLYQSADSSFYKATSSDEDGSFSFEDINFNTYFIKITSLGYEDYLSSSFILNHSQPDYDWGKIILKASDQVLDEISVITRKPLIELKPDRTTINIENSILSSGNTVIEILERLPGISFDRQSNQIFLKNKSGVLVMIDGRPTHLSGEALTQMLNNIMAEQIATIDIITQPSSKYEAAGSSGIIDIRLKKNKNFGTNGMLSLGSAYGFIPDSPDNLLRSTSNLNLNYRNQKWNVFGNASLGQDNWFYDGSVTRTAGNKIYDQYYLYHYKTPSSSFRGGFDYFITNKTTLGILGDIRSSKNNFDLSGKTTIHDETGKSNIIPDATSKAKDLNYTTNFNLTHQIDNRGRNLSIDLSRVVFNNTNLSTYNYAYSPASEVPYLLINRLDEPTHINILSGQIDFIIPTGKSFKLETGLKSSKVTADNDFTFEDLNDNKWEADPQKSNHFKYNEWVNAAYFSADYNIENWILKGGLRIEHTQSDGNSINTNQRNKNTYTNLFPSLFALQNINEQNSIRYSYSKRVDRPHYPSLNPFVSYVDPLTYEMGNPFLNPQYTNTFEVAYTLNQQYEFSVSYAGTNDKIYDIIAQDNLTGIVYHTKRNFLRNDLWSTNIAGMLRPTSWWQLNANAGLFYSLFKDPDILGLQLNKGKTGYNFLLANNFILNKGWMAEALLWYNSPQVMGIMDLTKPRYAINAGIQKTFLNNNARLKLNITDIFLTSFGKINISFADMNIEMISRYTSRRVGLTFTYNFGNKNVKMTQKTTSADELKGRADK